MSYPRYEIEEILEVNVHLPTLHLTNGPTCNNPYKYVSSSESMLADRGFLQSIKHATIRGLVGPRGGTP